jgi:hypothetical protein
MLWRIRRGLESRVLKSDRSRSKRGCVRPRTRDEITRGQVFDGRDRYNAARGRNYVVALGSGALRGALMPAKLRGLPATLLPPVSGPTAEHVP